MTNDQRQRVIEKILEDNDNETLFELLHLDFDDIFREALEKLDNDKLLDIIL